MRKLVILSATALFGLLGTGLAFADGPTTASATMVDPNTHAYVATLTESCGAGQRWPYVGVYLGWTFEIQNTQALSITAAIGQVAPGVNNTQPATVFTTSPRAAGEESMLSEIGGASKIGCLPVGSKVSLLYSAGGMLPLIRIVATGTVKSI